MDLRKAYALGGSTVHALDGVTLNVDQGEFVAVIGSSGSGKSTLMNMIGGLDQPDSGSVMIDGEDVGTLKPNALAAFRSNKLGFVFQQFQLMPRRTALSNVSLPLQYRRPPLSDGESRAQSALDSVGLGDRAHHKPTELSGGQQQRVAIARALVGSPSLLLADEPTGALDSQTSKEIMELLVSLNRSEGLTIILITHDLEVAAYADRVITMSDGQIVSDQRNQGKAA
ncbi:MAG: ABC transporter ATP-binding protein [Pseudomonadota bacterium]